MPKRLLKCLFRLRFSYKNLWNDLFIITYFPIELIIAVAKKKIKEFNKSIAVFLFISL